MSFVGSCRCRDGSCSQLVMIRPNLQTRQASWKLSSRDRYSAFFYIFVIGFWNPVEMMHFP